MKTDVDFDVDSNCSCAPIDADGPTSTTCGNDAVTFVHTRSGHRKYLCDDHAEQVQRFDVDLADHPRIGMCDACHRPTPVERMNWGGRCQDCQEDM